MSIEEINLFEIEKTFEKIRDDFTQYHVLIKSKESEKIIELEGRFLESQYKVDDGYVLLLVEGNIFGETLYINLISQDLNLIETIYLCTFYGEGILTNTQIEKSDTITFSFFNDDDRWALRIYKKPTFFFYKTSFLKQYHWVFRTKLFFQRSRLDLTDISPRTERKQKNSSGKE